MIERYSSCWASSAFSKLARRDRFSASSGTNPMNSNASGLSLLRGTGMSPKGVLKHFSRIRGSGSGAIVPVGRPKDESSIVVSLG